MEFESEKGITYRLQMNAKQFQLLKERVLEKRPILSSMLHKQGDKRLCDYATGYFDVNLNGPIIERQNEFLTVVKRRITELLDEKTAEEVVNQLKKYYLISTCDHHGPVTHPFFLNSNLITSLAGAKLPDHPVKYTLAMSTSNVYMNNSSFPRGLLFHSWGKDGLQLHRPAFFSKQSRTSVVWNYRSYVEQDVTDIDEDLAKEEQRGTLSQEVGKKVRDLVKEIYGNEKVLGAKNFCDQVTETNTPLWNKFFQGNEGIVPQLIYLEQKGVVRDVLLDYHMEQKTLLHQIIFNPEYAFYLRNYFHGIQGAFTDTGERGTYLFWAFPDGDSRRVALQYEQGVLKTADGSWSVELTPNAIADALRENKIIPGLLLSYFILSMYYGLKCIGGFNQINYLTQIKNGFIKMCADIGDYVSVELCARVQTKELSDGLTIAFLRDPTGAVKPAMGLDLYLYGNENTYNTLQKVMESVTLEQALDPILPEIYRTTYTEETGEPELFAITNADIMQFTGLDKKIEPCVEIG